MGKTPGHISLEFGEYKVGSLRSKDDSEGLMTGAGEVGQ